MEFPFKEMKIGHMKIQIASFFMGIKKLPMTKLFEN